MTKLNQIIAVANGKKSNVDKAVTEVYHKIQKAELFSGLNKTYRPLDENGETFPSENKYPQVKVNEAIDSVVASWSELFNVVATQDNANTQAKADLVVDGKVLLKNVPVTHLLFLEKQLTDVQTFVSKLPTLDPGEEWHFDDKVNYYKTAPSVNNRSVKEYYPFVKYEATDKHPAQVDTMQRDVKVGEWTTVKFSGCMEAKEKQDTLNRIKNLIEAVKEARELANCMEVEKVTEAETLFKHIFGK